MVHLFLGSCTGLSPTSYPFQYGGGGGGGELGGRSGGFCVAKGYQTL